MLFSLSIIGLDSLLDLDKDMFLSTVLFLCTDIVCSIDLIHQGPMPQNFLAEHQHHYHSLQILYSVIEKDHDECCF